MLFPAVYKICTLTVPDANPAIVFLLILNYLRNRKQTVHTESKAVAVIGEFITALPRSIVFVRTIICIFNSMFV